MGRFIVNKDQSRFEWQQDGHTATADYRIEGQTLIIEYVEAPPALRGTGAASRLMEHIVDHAATHQQLIDPVCSYAASWIRKHRL